MEDTQATLIDQVTEAEAQDTQALLAEYRALLLRNDKPGQGDAARLKELLPILGKTAADLKADLDVFAQARRLEQQIAGKAKAEAAKDKAHTAWQRFDAEREKKLAELEAERERLWGAVNEADSDHSRIDRAERELRILQQKHRALFGLPEPEEPEESPGMVTTIGPVREMTREEIRERDRRGKHQITPFVAHESYLGPPESSGVVKNYVGKERPPDDESHTKPGVYPPPGSTE